MGLSGYPILWASMGKIENENGLSLSAYRSSHDPHSHPFPTFHLTSLSLDGTIMDAWKPWTI